MAVVHNPMGEEELKLLDDVGTKAGDELEQTKQQEASVLQNCTCNQTPNFFLKCEITMHVLITYITAQKTFFLCSEYKSK